MRGFICMVLIFALITIFMPNAYAGLDYNVKVMVNEQQVNFPDQKPFVDNRAGRTFVPLRFVSEALGCDVDWDNETQTAVVERQGTYIEMQIGSDKPLVNSEFKTLDAPARLVNGRTMVPLRFVSEAMGEYVDWDGKTRTVYISDVPRELTDLGNGTGGNETSVRPGYHRPIDGGGGTNTTPIDDTPPIPWGN